MNNFLNSSMQAYYDQALVILNSLHFIRAYWFYAFFPLLLYIFLSLKTRLNRKSWAAIVDKQLLPFVLSKTDAKQRRYPLLLVFIAASLCITALAGPVYKKLPQPVYREQSALVVLLDLSQSMNATDIKPSRLSRARLELLDLLKSRKTGQTALVVYAADAFVVTPLTDDNATIANMVPSLETDMMPAQGSNLSNALAKTFSLFTQAGIVNGDVLVITDDIHPRDEAAINKLSSQGHRLSVFGIGTDAGAPIPLDGGFLQDSSGAIVIPKLQQKKLQRYALDGGGLYTSLQADETDTDKLSQLFQSSEVTQDVSTRDLNADIWQEEGHWLLLPLILLAALWARKGWLAIIVIFVLPALTPLSKPAFAETMADSNNQGDSNNQLSMQHLWSSPDQKAMEAFNGGDNKKAAENFTTPEWKASALYRDGDYEAAADVLQKINSSDGLYNRGNALAKLGKLEEAIKAYDKAIELDTKNEDARYNREQVKQALQQSKQQDDQQQDGQPQDEKQNKDSQKKDQQNSEQQESDQQDSDQQDSEQKNQQQENSQQQDSEQQSENKKDEEQTSPADKKQSQEQEQEQLKQRDTEAEAEQQKQEQQEYQQQQKKQDNPEQSDEQSDEQEDEKEDQAQDTENKNQEIEHKDSDEKPLDIEINPMEASITEEEKATEQWLKRIPDDPGGLLRRKFYYQYKQLPNQTDTEEPW